MGSYLDHLNAGRSVGLIHRPRQNSKGERVDGGKHPHKAGHSRVAVFGYNLIEKRDEELQDLQLRKLE